MGKDTPRKRQTKVGAPVKTRIYTELSRAELAQLRRNAKDDGRSMMGYVRHLIERDNARIKAKADKAAQATTPKTED